MKTLQNSSFANSWQNFDNASSPPVLRLVLSHRDLSQLRRHADFQGGAATPTLFIILVVVGICCFPVYFLLKLLLYVFAHVGKSSILFTVLTGCLYLRLSTTTEEIRVRGEERRSAGLWRSVFVFLFLISCVKDFQRDRLRLKVLAYTKQKFWAEPLPLRISRLICISKYLVLSNLSREKNCM